MGWALMFSDPDEGLFVWRLNVAGPRHPPWDGRFAWHMKRVDNEVAVNDPMFLLVEDPPEELVGYEVPILQEEFKRRWLSLVGPVTLRAPDPTTHSELSQQTLMEALVNTVKATNVPVVAGDELVVISDRAEITLNESVVDTVPRGTVLAVRGLAGDRLMVSYRRAGTISRSALISLDGSILKFTEEIQGDPDNSTLYTMRGTAWSFKGDHEKAIADHDRAIRLNPNSAIGFHRRGLAFGVESDYEKAIADFDKAHRIDPQNARILHDRGTTYQLKGDYDKAIADYDAALRQDPQYGLAYNSRGFVRAIKEENDQAIADFSEALRLDPNDAWAFLNRGRAWSEKGEWEKAAKDFGEAVRLDPNLLTHFEPKSRASLH